MTEKLAEDWPEAALATLYRATVSFGTQETQLVWTRYAGFLVLNGFLSSGYTQVSQIAKDGSPPNAWILLAIGVLGVAANAIWHTLNFAGWKNMCLFYHLAAKLSPHLGVFKLPTDRFKESIPNPFGYIYGFAQSVPLGFATAGMLVTLFALKSLIGSCVSAAVIVVIGTAAVLFVLIIEYRVIGPSVDRSGVNPA